MGWKRGAFMFTRYISAFIAALTLLWAGTALQAPVPKQRVLRLHVIANSDSPADQAAKLQVRDAVLRYEAEQLDTTNAQTVRQGILEGGEGLLSAVEDSLRESGMEYGARLSLGRYFFPEKTYGEATYPAGEYTALRIVLGEGAGQNWWCVLFPPLCILDVPYGEIEEEEVKSLFLELWKEGTNTHDKDG